MCLYPRYIKNRKYLPNKKNGGKPPRPTDARVEWVAVGCGNCVECRKQKAHQWQIRLAEELKIHKYAYFITLTFTSENLIELSKIAKTDEVNSIATIAMRRFLERWRKKFKTSLKHWCITELGQTNTERIHLHGIIFSETPVSNDLLTEIWKYGRTDTGHYCTMRTINYIIKYVTKIDDTHKNYKPIILASPALGKSYITSNSRERHKYIRGKTEEAYTLPNGTKTALPIYYRNHLWGEETREKIWLDRLDKNYMYIRGIKINKLDTPQGYKKYMDILRTQQQDNIKLGYGDNSKNWDKKEYQITLKMLNSHKK